MRAILDVVVGAVGKARRGIAICSSHRCYLNVTDDVRTQPWATASTPTGAKTAPVGVPGASTPTGAKTAPVGGPGAGRGDLCCHPADTTRACQHLWRDREGRGISALCTACGASPEAGGWPALAARIRLGWPDFAARRDGDGAAFSPGSGGSALPRQEGGYESV